MKISAFSITDLGRRRSLNEDFCICDNERQIYLVADGMGGREGGEVASRMAGETFLAKISPFLEDEDVTFPFEIKEERDFFSAIIKYAMEEANTAVYQHSLNETSKKGMGTTFTAAILYDGNLYVGHIGDSRLYRIRQRNIAQLSEDHTLVQQMIKEGRLDAKGARNHQKKNVITRSLGPKKKIKPDIFCERIIPGDIYLLCSDGLYQMLEDEELFGELLSLGEKDLETVGKNLIFMANENGGKDNITLLLFRVEEEN
ncbi:Stp1/IreP family PP2C-type Ser/Thr phosphatase [bacterium]|nr:Stp1/IreP family PP2C-type Ser/Thr phosphatase [bacterium]